MERGSDKHGPRIHDALERETESLTRGAPVEARKNEERLVERAGDGEPDPQALIAETESEGE